MAKARFEIFHHATPQYVCSVLSGDAHVLDAMREALRLERASGCRGWIIRDFRGTEIREYPAFLSEVKG